MIARHETHTEKVDVWAKLAATLPPGVVQWRQDGKPITRDGRTTARFVAYIDTQFVRERLDTVVPGEWDLTLDMLPNAADEDGAVLFAFKARLQILGVIREDVGTGEDYKQAATDAFKRAAVRFGIGHELYSYGQNWVQMDGDGKYAKPVEDPGAAYARRTAQAAGVGPQGDRVAQASAQAGEGVRRVERAAQPAQPAPVAGNGAPAKDVPDCPKCGGRMWDNRLSKRNPKAPDFKCRDRSCDGVVWPPRAQNGDTPAVQRARAEEDAELAALAGADEGDPYAF